MRKVRSRGLQRHARQLLGVGLLVALGLPGMADAGAGKPDSRLPKIALSEIDDTHRDASADDAPRTTLESLTTLAGFQFFPEKESEGLVLHEFNDPHGLAPRVTRRYSKMKLFRYDRRLKFRDTEVLLKVRTPGKRKSLVSLELKF